MGIWAMTVVQALFYEKGFSPSRVFLFFPGLLAKDFLSLACALGFFVPLKDARLLALLPSAMLS